MSRIQEMLEELKLELEPFDESLMIRLNNGSVFNTMSELEKYLERKTNAKY